jgi:hypothetical protein
MNLSEITNLIKIRDYMYTIINSPSFKHSDIHILNKKRERVDSIITTYLLSNSFDSDLDDIECSY